MGGPDRWRRLGFSHQFESKKLLQDGKAVRAGRQYICVHSNAFSCWSSCSALFSVPSSLDLSHQLHRIFLHPPIQVLEHSASPLRPPCLPNNSVQLEKSVGPGDPTREGMHSPDPFSSGLPYPSTFNASLFRPTKDRVCPPSSQVHQASMSPRKISCGSLRLAVPFSQTVTQGVSSNFTVPLRMSAHRSSFVLPSSVMMYFRASLEDVS